jgi:diphthamide synthase (EF-2-diphthine--ammonia ligase)
VKILLAWSSGKDSAWALHVLQQQYPGAVAGLVTTINEAVQRVAMHAVRRDVLELQASAAGQPLRSVPLPDPCSNDEYEARMRTAAAEAVAEGFTHVAFGDLFLEDVRLYRQALLADSGLTPRWAVDPCGENGEFHTCVYGGPMFSGDISIETGEMVVREPFAWRDFVLARVDA